MRDEKIEILLSLAGNENRYQYFTLLIFLFLWMNCNFMPVVLPYLEREPLVKYIDENNIMHINETLSNEICGQKYEILKRFGYSWVSEYDIECNKLYIGLIGVFTFIGNTLGSIAFSIITKYFTHKKILIIFSIGFSLSIYACTIINSKIYLNWLLILLIFAGLFGNCLSYSSLVVCEEIVSSRKRSFFSSIINMGYGLCGIMYSLIFKYFQNWRYPFYILIGFSLLLGLIIWIFIYDSPRIYIDNNDLETTVKILEGIANFNGLKKEFLKKIETEEYKQLINEIIDYNYHKAIEMKEINDGNNKEKKDELIEISDNISEKKKNKFKMAIFTSLKYPSLRKKFLILCILWLGTNSTSICIALSSKSLPGNYYYNIIILFFFESLAYFVSGIFINIKSLGRRGTLWLHYLIISFTFILLSFAKFPNSLELGLNFLVRFCAAAIELVFYTYTLEVYPTPVRSLNFGINLTFGNIGASLSPLIYEYLPSWLFLFILAIFSIFNAVLLIFLPETVGRPMIESIEEINEK